ncbi:MAG TPA: rRNA maturation RNase YbeY [Candidatus Limnocylindrales bacterium]|nr:rRNA maturation RNase YbeY [Candidatus Limnocylindrales bacterium]
MAAIYLPPWRIDVSTRPGVASPVPIRALARLAARALSVVGAPPPASLALILSDDTELATLNEQHMGHEGPTDVLSFPMLTPGFALPPGRRPHLGDIVISIERAAEQASEGRGGQTSDMEWSAADELRLLVVHGVLHVCGHDHAEPGENEKMRALEKRILAGQ